MVSKKPILIDTDIFIDMLAGIPEAKLFFEQVQDNAYDAFVSPITIAELHRGKSAEHVKVSAAIEQLLDLCSTIPITREISKKAGVFSRKYRQKLPDMLIAACVTDIKNCTLITRNVRDFKEVDEITVLNPY